ncbi:low affinity immunoglobulin gamma Fc region receptor III-B-like [Mixophyes fleayi]|uniref:low affinity immunoglobulin gamma Fc region receptor III-B-like n=1 Tax=Mixophyes fleayi TaxID=3061075 RepID=UPI003F4E1C19
MVTFTPNWRNIFMYESVTITCNVGSTVQDNQKYSWYKDKKIIFEHQQSFTLQSASIEDRGDYQCKTTTSDKSDPLRLYVIDSMLILQRPHTVYEGVPLTLRCHSFPGYNTANTTFFKNNTIVQFSANDSELRFTKVDFNLTGLYKCTKQIYNHGKYQIYSAEAFVSVQGRTHTDYSLTWILAAAFPLVFLCFALLLYKYRHKLSSLVRGHQRQQTIADSDGQLRAEEDVNYTYIDINCLKKDSPAPKTGNDDYSIIYSLVTQAATIETTNSS